MSENKVNIEIKPLRDLYGMKFFIPDYQRGYKWKSQQINDLLDDLWEFYEDDNDDFYCLQPLAVSKRFNLKTESKSLDILLNQLKERVENENEEVKKIRITRDGFIDSLEEKWEVIDGQQRLTTMFLILCYLSSVEGNTSAKENLYSIEYETREYSQTYLNYFKNYNRKKDIVKNQSNLNPDYHYIYEAYTTIEEWFKNKSVEICRNRDVSAETDGKRPDSEDSLKADLTEVDIEDGNEDFKKQIEKFTITIKNSVNFIWYDSNANAIDVFTSLNIGKIGLTNSELIKALLLNGDNFGRGSNEVLKNEIALEWDRIEKTLQNDELWLFIHEKNYNKPARIDYIFDIICDNDLLKLKEDNIEKQIGNDKYRTFRYVDLYFRIAGNNFGTLESIWKTVKELDAAINDWFNDLEMYHYIGYLIDCGIADVGSLYVQYSKTTHQKFKTWVKEKIKNKIDLKQKCDIEAFLDKQYEREVSGKAVPKSKCRPVLLLHNILTIIKQNRVIESTDKFKTPVFYKFPFHLLKRDNWDVEHIDSNTTNNLHDNYSYLLWLIQYLKNENVKSDIETILKQASIPEGKLDRLNSGITFDEKLLDLSKIENKINNSEDLKTHLNDLEKNKIWNFTLLDSSTNRSYGNSIFPSKRRTIAAREKGEVLALDVHKDEEGNYTFNFKKDTEAKGVISFIPPVTRNVFMKYYTPSTTNFSYWDKDDAKAYRNDIKELLEDFLAEK